MSTDVKVFTIKVTNVVDGRIDIHKDLLSLDVEYIRANPNLRVEVMEINIRKGR
jgi:hypothetical protein